MHADRPNPLRPSIDPRLVALDVTGVQRLGTALADAGNELSSLIDRAERLARRGRPINLRTASLVFQFAQCWRSVTGHWPGVSVNAENGDSGPFARWFNETWSAIYPGTRFATVRTHGSLPTKIRDTLVYLREGKLMED